MNEIRLPKFRYTHRVNLAMNGSRLVFNFISLEKAVEFQEGLQGHLENKSTSVVMQDEIGNHVLINLANFNFSNIEEI